MSLFSPLVSQDRPSDSYPLFLHRNDLTHQRACSRSLVFAQTGMSIKSLQKRDQALVVATRIWTSNKALGRNGLSVLQYECAIPSINTALCYSLYSHSLLTKKEYHGAPRERWLTIRSLATLLPMYSLTCTEHSSVPLLGF